MARRYAPVLCSIWDDPDYQQRTQAAQRLYILLLSQKRMSLVGVIPYSPRNWSRGSVHTTVDDIETALHELIEHGYVLVDLDTDELLVRTMVKHDPPRGPKVRAAAWRALAAVDSQTIRKVIIDQFEDDLWNDETVHPPEWAKTLRNTPSDTPSDGDRTRARASSCLLPPTSDLLPPSTFPLTSRPTHEVTRGVPSPVDFSSWGETA